MTKPCAKSAKNNQPAPGMEAALRPIHSLIGKSEKAVRKLKPGTWQHTMLCDNLRALHLAVALLGGCAAVAFSRDEGRAALEALASMIDRTVKSRAKFAPGTSQHTLQRNRLQALRLAEARIKADLAER